LWPSRNGYVSTAKQSAEISRGIDPTSRTPLSSAGNNAPPVQTDGFDYERFGRAVASALSGTELRIENADGAARLVNRSNRANQGR